MRIPFETKIVILSLKSERYFGLNRIRRVEMSQPVEQPEDNQQSPRQTYEPPQLLEYGTILELTKFGINLASATDTAKTGANPP